MMIPRYLRELVDDLKDELPTERPVTVKVVPMSRAFGSTSLSGRNRITVCIAAGLSQEQAEDTLVHEWGHVLHLDTWEDHGDDWGMYQAQAYRILEARRDEE